MRIHPALPVALLLAACGSSTATPAGGSAAAASVSDAPADSPTPPLGSEDTSTQSSTARDLCRLVTVADLAGVGITAIAPLENNLPPTDYDCTFKDAAGARVAQFMAVVASGNDPADAYATLTDTTTVTRSGVLPGTGKSELRDAGDGFVLLAVQQGSLVAGLWIRSSTTNATAALRGLMQQALARAGNVTPAP